jgi:hypothetical protein
MKLFNGMILLTFLSISMNSNAEVVDLLDGRSVDLKLDGTYAFVENNKQITVSVSNCKNEVRTEPKKDDFNNIVGYAYFVGFSLQYKIINQTDFPLVVRKLGTEFSRDYGMFYTLIKMPTYADPIEPGKNLVMKRSSHLFYVKTNVELNDDQVEALTLKHGCSTENFTGQTIFIDTGVTKMKFPPDAGNLDPMDLLSAVSEIEGLTVEVR